MKKIFRHLLGLPEPPDLDPTDVHLRGKNPVAVPERECSEPEPEPHEWRQLLEEYREARWEKGRAMQEHDDRIEEHLHRLERAIQHALPVLGYQLENWEVESVGETINPHFGLSVDLVETDDGSQFEIPDEDRERDHVWIPVRYLDSPGIVKAEMERRASGRPQRRGLRTPGRRSDANCMRNSRPTTRTAPPPRQRWQTSRGSGAGSAGDKHVDKRIRARGRMSTVATRARRPVNEEFS